MFGGRSNDLVVEHNPRTYRIAEVSGVLDVTTYDQQPVRECAADDTTCTYDISIAEYYNDVWQYDLGASRWGPRRDARPDRHALRRCHADCARWADNGCAYRGWEVLNAGARFGGCEIMVKPASGEWREDCPLPFERYLHAAAMHEFRCERAAAVCDGMECAWYMLAHGGLRGAPKLAATRDGASWCTEASGTFAATFVRTFGCSTSTLATGPERRI